MQKFLKAALTPIARICIRRGIPLQKFFEAAKHAFILAATEELALLNSKPSVSRIAAMTGLQRKEIKRIEGGESEPASSLPLLAKILGSWCDNSRFTNKRGKPRKLSLSPDQNEFANLVASVSTDLSPYTALFELERNGAVKKDGAYVRLLHPSIEISADQEAGLQLFAEDFDKLSHTLENNIFTEPDVPDLHARTEYDNIAPSALPKVRLWILEHGAKFHSELRAYLSRFDRDLNPSLDKNKKRVTVSVGSYCAVSKAMEKKGGSK